MDANHIPRGTHRLANESRSSLVHLPYGGLYGAQTRSFPWTGECAVVDTYNPYGAKHQIRTDSPTLEAWYVAINTSLAFWWTTSVLPRVLRSASAACYLLSLAARMIGPHKRPYQIFGLSKYKEHGNMPTVCL